MVEPMRFVSALPNSPSRPPAREPGLLRLGHNERTARFPDDFFAAMVGSITQEDVLAIPDLTSLYTKLSGYLRVTQDQLLLSPGADASLDWIFHAYVEAGDRVVHVTPTYHRYAEFCRLYGAEPSAIQCDERLEYDLEGLIDAIGVDTRLVIIVNPHSPTGRVLAFDAIETVIARAAAVGAMVVVDEVYHPFGEVSCVSAAVQLPNVVVVRSFSKAFGAAGLRVGYAVASSEVIRQLAKVRIRHEVSAVSARMAEYLLDHPRVMEDYVAEVAAARDRLGDLLAGSGYVVEPSQSSAVMIRIPDSIERSRVEQELLLRRIEVSAGLQAPYERYLRVTVGPWNQMVIFAEALRAATDAAQATARG
jgi:histidinol-phosphate aminotransferase